VPDTNVKPIKFPVWVPEDARATLSTFYNLLSDRDCLFERDCRFMLQRLATRHSMQEVWTRLRSFEKITPNNLVTLTYEAWLSTRRMGQLGSKSRLRKARKKDSEPPSYSDKTQQVHAIIAAIEAIDPFIRAANEITDVTLQELKRVANFFQRQDDAIDFSLKIAPFSRKLGAHNADQIAFVNYMCGLPWSHTGSRQQPYSLIAILTNVAFDLPEKKEWDADRVKHCYASRSRSK
jgi:hypothetical protein